MGKIFCLIGKSSSGKDTIYQELITSNRLPLLKLIPYTTRPIRTGEIDGNEYFFKTEEELNELMAQNKIIELRSYHTVHGVWHYFTAKDHQIDLEQNHYYLVIGTIESFLKMRDYFGSEFLVPIYIVVDDGIRLQRALDRERMQSQPKYQEMCRRFIADEQDFSEKKLRQAGIDEIFVNDNLLNVQNKIINYILSFIDTNSHPI